VKGTARPSQTLPPSTPCFPLVWRGSELSSSAACFALKTWAISKERNEEMFRTLIRDCCLIRPGRLRLPPTACYEPKLVLGLVGGRQCSTFIPPHRGGGYEATFPGQQFRAFPYSLRNASVSGRPRPGRRRPSVPRQCQRFSISGRLDAGTQRPGVLLCVCVVATPAWSPTTRPLPAGSASAAPSGTVLGRWTHRLYYAATGVGQARP
jgi:hypothetical protein